MCPFCYIGKRHFETALQQFPHRDEVSVEWRSFQLNPRLEHQPGKDVYDYVAEMKGQTREWSVRLHENVVATARKAGLDYRFDKAQIANSRDAHRLIQLAKKHGLADEVEERFFKAYFTEGELMSDHATLSRLAVEAGLEAEEVNEVLAGDDFAEDVRRDGEAARLLGIGGVPFFAVERKYGVSGAQPVAAFSEMLEKTFANWKKEQPQPDLAGGAVCTPEGDCS